MIKIYPDNSDELKYGQFIFPGGEVSVRLLESDRLHDCSKVLVVADLQSAKDIIELFMITDAIRRVVPTIKINLTIPYIPYARQDRVSVEGEALSISVFAKLINAQNYETVTVWDPHSDVSTALIDRAVILSQEVLACTTPIDWTRTVLVAPDAGAAKKIYKLAKLVGSKVITASKERDSITGKISATKIDIKGLEKRNFLIVDDICDGGRTFTELAKVMREQGASKIDLYVTHGIFSKGMNVFDGLIDDIYCANPWLEDKRITVI